MVGQRTRPRLFLLLALSWLRSGGGGGGHSSGGGADADVGTGTTGNSGSSSGSGTQGDGPEVFWVPSGTRGGYYYYGNGAGNRVGFGVERALDIRRNHGILAALAVVLLFPIGSVLLRVIPGRFAVWVHAAFQVLAWCVYVAAAGLGIYLVRVVNIPGGGLLQNPSTRYHPIIGLVLLALLVVQPVVSFVHHRVYKKLQKRQVWSYLHLAIGRVGITLGIINGGLGLYISNASAYHKKVYAAVAAVMWVLWMGVAIWAEVKRFKTGRGARYTAVAKTPAGEERGSQE